MVGLRLDNMGGQNNKTTYRLKNSKLDGNVISGSGTEYAGSPAMGRPYSQIWITHFAQDSNAKTPSKSVFDYLNSNIKHFKLTVAPDTSVTSNPPTDFTIKSWEPASDAAYESSNPYILVKITFTENYYFNVYRFGGYFY